MSNYIVCHTIICIRLWDSGQAYCGLWAIVVIAYLIYKLVKSEKILLPSRIVSSKSAEDILDERYAKRELTREQYMQIKEDIKETNLMYHILISLYVVL